MAIFRKINVSFWSDTFIESLDKDQKLFYLYLLTNTETKQCGIYEISKKKISYDLGCSIDTVSKHLAYFISKDKIMYNEPTNEIALKNWAKYNGSGSPKVVKCIESELKNVKHTVLIEYVKGMYTASQEEEEQEEEQEEEKEEVQEQVYRKFDHLKLSISDFEKLKVDYSQKQIDDVLDSIENYKNNKSYKSLYLTAKKWLANEKNKIQEQKKADTNFLRVYT